MLSSSNSVALDVRQRCQSLRERRRLLVDTEVCERGWRLGPLVEPSPLSVTASRHYLVFEHLAESGERLDLERVRVADDVFTEALACGEDFLRSSDIGDEHVLWDRYDDRQPTSGAAPVGNLTLRMVRWR